MGILSRYLVRAVASHSGIGFLVVLSVFVVTRLNSLLADSAAGALPGDVVLELLGLRALMALPSLLPATLYIGMLLALSRMARDHELEAMHACGVAPRRQYTPVGVFGCVVAVVIGFLSFTGRPWAAARFQQTQEQAVANARLGDIPLGTFIEVDGLDHTVLFAESHVPGQPGSLQKVLLQQTTDEGLRITVAERAFESSAQTAGLRYLNLINGIEYEIDTAGEHLNVSEFQQTSLRIAVPAADPDSGIEKTLPFADLWGSSDPATQAELQWRAAMPISALLLVAIAIPLAQAGSGRNRYLSAPPALLIYLVYRTLLGTAKNWVADGDMPWFPGVWLVHLAAAAAAGCLWVYRFGNVGWPPVAKILRAGRAA